jgi:hypothetical protein
VHTNGIHHRISQGDGSEAYLNPSAHTDIIAQGNLNGQYGYGNDANADDHIDDGETCLKLLKVSHVPSLFRQSM